MVLMVVKGDREFENLTLRYNLTTMIIVNYSTEIG